MQLEIVTWFQLHDFDSASIDRQYLVSVALANTLLYVVFNSPTRKGCSWLRGARSKLCILIPKTFGPNMSRKLPKYPLPRTRSYRTRHGNKPQILDHHFTTEPITDPAWWIQ
jgi:hypothetical protein